MSSGEVHKKYVYFTDKFITSEGYNNSSTKLVPKNSVLIALAGQGKTRGTVAINKIELCTNQSIASIIPNDNLYYKFLFYYLESKYDYLRALSSSDGGRGGLNLKLIRSIPIKIPDFNEQKKISDFIELIDTKRTILEKKYEYYHNFKKYLMQQIFSQKLRFENKEEWKTVKLGDICKIKTGKLDANAMVENGKYRFYTCAKEFYFIDDYAYDTEALLISGNGAHVGYIHYYNGKFNAYQRTYIFDQFTENIKLIMYILDKSLKKRIHQEKNEGSTPYIKLSTLKDMKIDIPHSKTEQEKITSIFTNINSKLDYIDVELKNVQNFKKGLLQQMFI